MQGHRSGNFFQIDIGSLQLDQTKSVALLTKVGEFPNGNDLSFKAHTTWEELETGKQNESSVVNSTLKVVTLKKAESAAINSTVVKKVADLWEASLAYQAMIFNEQNRFGRASRIYDDNMESYDLLINSLEDSDARIYRLNAAQKKVSAPWKGRSKRASYNLSKKMMMSEPDLRDRDTGNWHDEI
jgi:hypothetical protein